MFYPPAMINSDNLEAGLKFRFLSLLGVSFWNTMSRERWPLTAQLSALGPRSSPFASHSGSRRQCVCGLSNSCRTLCLTCPSTRDTPAISPPGPLLGLAVCPLCIRVHTHRKEASHKSWKLTLVDWKGNSKILGNQSMVEGMCVGITLWPHGLFFPLREPLLKDQAGRYKMRGTEQLALLLGFMDSVYKVGPL